MSVPSSTAAERRRSRARRALGLAMLVPPLLLALRAAPARGESDQDRRDQAGIRLFRSLLAADLDLDSKRDEDGKLLLVIFHAGDQTHAQELARALAGSAAEPEPLRGVPVKIELTNDPTFGVYGKHPPAGIFIGQSPSSSGLQSIVHYGIDHHRIVYSPFEGHVEHGVLAGMSVEAQVRPYVNTETLAASHVELKSFFMKVTKVYP